MPMTAVWLFAIPLLDTTTVMWRRIKEGNSPFNADQHHFHHAFLRAGFTVGQTWWVITALAMSFAASGMAFELNGVPDYVSFWCFMVVAVIFKRYMKQTWHLQQFLGRDFIYNEPDNV
jgi:UDP-GlcNAc:undecaprenyl-phosphate GlcNAc-1-phosphate transferase